MDGGPWTSLGALSWFVGVWARDDGGDDVSLGLADGRSLLEAHAGRGPSARRWCSRPATCSRGRPSVCSAFVVAAAGGRLRRRARLGRGGSVGRGVTLLVAAAVRGDAAEGRLPGQVPEPARLPRWARGVTGSRARCAWVRGTAPGASGCCWALMASLFALGVMSIGWMAFVAGLIALEKTLPWRRAATWGTAAALLLLGVLMLVAPERFPA